MHRILQNSLNSIQNHKYILLETNDYDDYKGYRVFLLKESKDDIALLIFSYEINNQSKELISKLYESNMNIKIISGDLKDPVIDTCKKIGINKIKTIDMSVNITNMNRQILSLLFCYIHQKSPRSIYHTHFLRYSPRSL